MSVREGLEFDTDICSDTAPLNHTVMQLLDVYGHDIHFLRDPTRGGVASVLNEVAELTNLGFSLDQNRLPIFEQVDAACEMLGLDPLYVANEGLILAIVDASIADRMIKQLHEDPLTANAAVIGEVVLSHPGKVTMKSRIGGTRVVNYLTGEQLPRIC